MNNKYIRTESTNNETEKLKPKLKKMKITDKTYLILSISIIVLGLILSFTYRPFIYSNNLNDLGFADTIGSLIAVIGFCFFVWGFKEYSNKEKNKQIIIATLIYSFGWELIGFLGIHGTFDKKDIVAALFSGLITFIIKEFLARKKQNKFKDKINKSTTA